MLAGELGVGDKDDKDKEQKKKKNPKAEVDFSYHTSDAAYKRKQQAANLKLLDTMENKRGNQKSGTSLETTEDMLKKSSGESKIRAGNLFEISLSSASSDSEDEESKRDFFWNTRFQALLDKKRQLETKDSKEKGDSSTMLRVLEELTEHCRDFIAVAEAYGRIIISEYYLPNDIKSIEPLAGYGVAGGEKYIVQGMLFKFYLDVKMAPGVWLYGGKTKNTEKAMKSACNELKGLASLFQCRQHELRFPLQTLIHFRGFCTVAVALIPIKGSDTMVYGSNDGGKTVQCMEPFRGWFTEAAQRLNLDKHSVHGQVIYGPGDIEGHLGRDNKYYCLDFGRVMPPEAPLPDLVKEGKAIWYDLLRPTFVGRYYKGQRKSNPLCSDCFSGWMRNEPNREQKEAELLKATKLLYKKLVPKVANELKALVSEYESKGKVFTGDFLVDFIHQKGLNCRHLGFVREHLKGDDEDTKRASDLVLHECVARGIKNLVRKVLRREMVKKKVAAPEPYVKVVYKVIKPIFYYVQPYPRLMSETTQSGQPKPGSLKGATNTIVNESGRTFYLSNFSIPDSQRTFFFEVSLKSELGKQDNMWIGFVPVAAISDNSVTIIDKSSETGLNFLRGQVEATRNIWLENGWFFNFREGKFTIPGFQEVSFTAAKEGDSIGFFLDLKANQKIGGKPSLKDISLPTLLLTRNSLTLGDFTRVSLRAGETVRPAFIVEGNVTVQYNLGPTFDSENTKFPVFKLCQALSVPKPVPEKVPSLNLFKEEKVNSNRFWTESQFLKATLNRGFPHLLTKEEEGHNHNLRESMNMAWLLSRFSDISGVEFSEKINSYKTRSGTHLRLTFGDVIALGSRVSKMSIMEEAESKRVLRAALLKKSHYCRSKVDRNLQDDLLRASQQLARIIDNTPFIFANHVDFVYYQVRILYEVGLIDDTVAYFESAEHILLKWVSELPQDYRKSVPVVWQEKLDFLLAIIYIELVKANESSLDYQVKYSTAINNLWQKHPAYVAKKLARIDQLMDACTDATDAEFWYNQFQKLRSIEVPKDMRRTVTTLRLAAEVQAATVSESTTCTESSSRSTDDSSEDRHVTSSSSGGSKSRIEMLTSSNMLVSSNLARQGLMMPSPLRNSALGTRERDRENRRRSAVYPGFSLPSIVGQDAGEESKADKKRQKAKGTDDILLEISKIGLSQQFSSEVKQLWKKFDEDGSGEMELPEARKFFSALFRWLVKNGSLHRENEQETIERWIIEFDEDKSGTISQDEFHQALIGLLKPTNLELQNFHVSCRHYLLTQSRSISSIIATVKTLIKKKQTKHMLVQHLIVLFSHVMDGAHFELILKIFGQCTAAIPVLAQALYWNSSTSTARSIQVSHFPSKLETITSEMIEQMDQRMDADPEVYSAAKLALQNLQQVKGYSILAQDIELTEMKGKVLSADLKTNSSLILGKIAEKDVLLVLVGQDVVEGREMAELFQPLQNLCKLKLPLVSGNRPMWKAGNLNIPGIKWTFPGFLGPCLDPGSTCLVFSNSTKKKGIVSLSSLNMSMLSLQSKLLLAHHVLYIYDGLHKQGLVLPYIRDLLIDKETWSVVLVDVTAIANKDKQLRNFSSFSCAPEIRGGEVCSEEADMWGYGHFVNVTLGISSFYPPFFGLKWKAREPSQRPTFAEIIAMDSEQGLFVNTYLWDLFQFAKQKVQGTSHQKFIRANLLINCVKDLRSDDPLVDAKITYIIDQMGGFEVGLPPGPLSHSHSPSLPVSFNITNSEQSISASSSGSQIARRPRAGTETAVTSSVITTWRHVCSVAGFREFVLDLDKLATFFKILGNPGVDFARNLAMLLAFPGFLGTSTGDALEHLKSLPKKKFVWCWSIPKPNVLEMQCLESSKGEIRVHTARVLRNNQITWDGIVDVLLSEDFVLWSTPMLRCAKELAAHFSASTFRFGHYGLKEIDKASKCSWCGSGPVKLLACAVCGMTMHAKEKSQVCYGEANWLTNCCTFMRLNKYQSSAGSLKESMAAFKKRLTSYTCLYLSDTLVLELFMLKIDLPKASKMRENLFKHSSQYQLPTPLRIKESELSEFYEFCRELTADRQVIDHFIQNFNSVVVPLNTKITDAILLASLTINPANQMLVGLRIPYLLASIEKMLTNTNEHYCAMVIAKAVKRCARHPGAREKFMHQVFPLCIKIIQNLLVKKEVDNNNEDDDRNAIIENVLSHICVWAFYGFRYYPRLRKHLLHINMLPTLLQLAEDDLHLYFDLPQDENHEITVIRTEVAENEDKKILKTIHGYGQKTREKDLLFSYVNGALTHQELAFHFICSSPNHLSIVGLLPGPERKKIPLYPSVPTLLDTMSNYIKNSGDKKGRLFDTQWVVQIALQIANAIQTVHTVGFGLGDLRLGDVFSDNNFVVRVFMRSLTLDQEILDLSKSVLPQYSSTSSLLFAPELKSGHIKSLKPVDIFNFATILWQILLICDRRIFELPRPSKSNTKKQKLASHSAELKKLINRMWHQRPSKRPTIEVVIETLAKLPNSMEACPEEEGWLLPYCELYKLVCIPPPTLLVLLKNSMDRTITLFQDCCYLPPVTVKEDEAFPPPCSLWFLVNNFLDLHDQSSLACTCKLIRRMCVGGVKVDTN
eukprot:TRINITY_DN959_c1_g2_i6.p1 TRINITY_DN959_c1_g2~~TRINITY_DN959_c1_g2_i6.p1  ORF type:complete len:2608 (+),score=507.45 TRINITY_DN959_c1_g2_i6:305-8128(+)